jgi:hypothetical protein
VTDTRGPILPRPPHRCRPFPCQAGDEVSESRLKGGVNRANLKFTNFKHNYKPGLELELNLSPKERAKTNHKQIRRITR